MCGPYAWGLHSGEENIFGRIQIVSLEKLSPSAFSGGHPALNFFSRVQFVSVVDLGAELCQLPCRIPPANLNPGGRGEVRLPLFLMHGEGRPPEPAITEKLLWRK